jgi:hypothetical protein
MMNPSSGPEFKDQSINSFEADRNAFHVALEPILRRLILIQSHLQDLEKRFDQVESVENALKAQRSALENLSRNDNEQARASSAVDEHLVRMEKLLQQVQRDLGAQHKLANTYFGWKYIIGQLLTVTVVTSAVVIIGLRMFPPNPHPLLDRKLQILFDRIENIRQQNK